MSSLFSLKFGKISPLNRTLAVIHYSFEEFLLVVKATIVHGKIFKTVAIILRKI
jgi:hypothetical protein